MIYNCKRPSFSYHALIFLFLFIPYIKVGGLILHLPYYYLFVFSILFIIIFSFGVVAKEYFYILFLFSLSYFWILAVSATNGVIDLQMQIDYFNAFLVTLGAFGLSIFIVKRFGSESGAFLVRAIYFSGVAHAVIMVLVFFVEPLRELLYSFVVLGEKGQEFVDNLYRSPGLTTGGGDALSVVQATSLVFGLYYLISLQKKTPFSSILLHLSFYSVLFLSILLSARTGLVVLALGIFMLGIRHICLMLKKGKLSKDTIIKFICIFIAVSIILPALYLELMESSYSRFARRAFELYNNFIEYGVIETSSTQHLKKMYFLPELDMSIFFGDGNFGRDISLGIINSDVGYIRVIFGAGIFGLLLFYVPLVLVFFYFRKRAVFYSLLFPIKFIVLMLLVVNLKVYHLYGAGVGFKIFLLIVSVLIAQNYAPNKSFYYTYHNRVPIRS